MTDRKQMEAELVKSQRFVTIGETAAMVGHDLRNPLQAIVSTIYLAKRELESLPEPSRETAVKPSLVEMLETIENESYYMNKIVSDLQDYATPLKPEPKPSSNGIACQNYIVDDQYPAEHQGLIQGRVKHCRP